MIFTRWLAQALIVAAAASCRADAPEASPGNSAVPADSNEVAVAAPKADSSLITHDGWGPLRIGMSTAEVVSAAGEDANPAAVGGPDPEKCDEFRPAHAPAGILVMVENGILTRISVSRNSTIKTREGFAVGDSASRILEHYGARARVDPHQYWADPAKYITVWREAPSETDRRGIRYEIDADGKVVHIRAGARSIEYVEGCV